MRFTNINSPYRLPGAIYAIYSARPPNSPQGKLSKVANSNQALTTLSWRVQLLGSSFRFRKRNSLFRLRVAQKVEAVTWFGCRHSLQCLRMSIHPRLSDTKCPLNIPGYGSPVRHLGWWTSQPAVAWNPGYENETTSSQRCPNVLSVHVKPPLYHVSNSILLLGKPNFAESLLRSAESNPALFVPRCSRFIQKLLVWSRKPNSKLNFSPDQSTCLSLADSSPYYLDIHQFARSHKKKSFPIEHMAFAAYFKMSIPYMPYIYILYIYNMYIFICVPQKNDRKRFLSFWGHRAAVRCSPIFGRPQRRNSTPWKAWRTRERGNNVGTTWDGKMWWLNDVKCGKTGKTMNDCEV